MNAPAARRGLQGPRGLRGLDRLCAALAALAGAWLVAIAAAIVFQATARSLGFSGSPHLFAFTEYGLFYIAMLAAPQLAAERGHVAVELAVAALPARARPAASWMAAALAAAVCLVFAWFAGDAALAAWTRGDVDMRSFDMPRWLLLGAMPPCFALTAAQFARFALGPETCGAPPAPDGAARL